MKIYESDRLWEELADDGKFEDNNKVNDMLNERSLQGWTLVQAVVIGRYIRFIWVKEYEQT